MRFSFWVPKQYRWIRDIIKEIQFQASKKGVKLSQADVILSCLISQLEDYLKSIGFVKKEFQKKRTCKEKSKTRKKRNISCCSEDVWLFEAIDRIVETKKSLGIKTTFSYELIRVAKNGFIGSRVGSDFDKKVKI